MTSKEISEYDSILVMNNIVEDYLLKGQNNPTVIAKELGLKRAQVVGYIEDWKKIAQNDEQVKARSRELLTEMDKTYDQLIREFWILHAESESVKDKNGILKNIAEIVEKRRDVFQKTGLYDDAAIGDELAVVEEQMEGIRNLLKQVAKNHPAARQEIMDGLGKIFHVATSMPVEEAVNPTA